eukprot:8481977-Pyramimonas_sp.AAC.1
MRWSESLGVQTVHPLKRLEVIWKRAQVLCRDFDSSPTLNDLSMSMSLTQVSGPHVGHAVLEAKAAECNHVIPVLAQISAELSTGSECGNHNTGIPVFGILEF